MSSLLRSVLDPLEVCRLDAMAQVNPVGENQSHEMRAFALAEHCFDKQLDSKTKVMMHELDLFNEHRNQLDAMHARGELSDEQYKLQNAEHNKAHKESGTIISRCYSPNIGYVVFTAGAAVAGFAIGYQIYSKKASSLPSRQTNRSALPREAKR